jgi:hypothetical protein
MLQKQQQAPSAPAATCTSASPPARPKCWKPRSCATGFADEMGARLTTRAGVDRDLYDAFCEHLIVRDEDAGRIVGTYRILSPSAAREVGSYYSETEFDLTRLRHLRAAWWRSAAPASTPTTAPAP